MEALADTGTDRRRGEVRGGAAMQTRTGTVVDIGTGIRTVSL